ncbi:MAG: hypothetical protein ACIAQZ_09350 [Sedimentisphaeraceae bacterium JB056]
MLNHTHLIAFSICVIVFFINSSIGEVENGYQKRFNNLVQEQLQGAPQSRKDDVYGRNAALRLVKGVDLDEVNAIVKEVAQWFEHPHPRGRMLDGEVDFAAATLCRLYYLTKDNDNLYLETKQAIEKFFTEYDFKSIFPSENHYLLFRSSRYLMASTLALPPEDFPSGEYTDETIGTIYMKDGIYHRWFENYRDEAAVLAVQDKNWLLDFMRFRTEKGWGEFDSAYIHAQFECMLNLYDFSPDQKIKELARLNLDMLTLGMAINSVEGIYGGARGRGGPKSGFDHKTPASYLINYLYFDNNQLSRSHFPMIHFYGTEYRPLPLIVKLARGEREPYVNLERVHLHNVLDPRPFEPLEGSIRKYTYVTPKYIMGCVQYQDDYPEGHAGAWYRNHQQHQWDLSFVGDTLLRVFTGHPLGPDDGEPGRYWIGSGGQFFQQRNALIALYDIEPRMTYQYIHAYFPRQRFDEIVERGNWIFGRYGKSAVGLRFSSPYKWVTEGRYKDEEIICEGSKHAVVCETANLDDKSFEQFINELTSNKAEFNKEKMYFVYSSKSEGVLEIDIDGKRRHNGRDENLDYPRFVSPFAYSEWGSGEVAINYDGEKIVLKVE